MVDSDCDEEGPTGAHLVRNCGVRPCRCGPRRDLANTTTIGIRQYAVDKYALRREFRSVTIDGQQIAVKLGILPDGRVVNAMPEWDDVARAAAALAKPVKNVLAQAVGLAATFTNR